jgi:hypothetical protein
MDWEALIAVGCQFLEALIGSIGTILMIALAFGLVCLAAGLTVAVIWHHLGLGFRFAVLRAWVQIRSHVAGTARLYYRRIKWYGHTRPSTWIAVA